MGTFEVERMGAGEASAAVVTLARSFYDDPLFNFLVPDLLSQARASLRFMSSGIADARPFDEVADPVYRRQGAGTALLAPVLERCDAGGVPAYLETQKEANLAWYHRFGFAVLDELRVKGAPPMRTMRRDPR